MEEGARYLLIDSKMKEVSALSLVVLLFSGCSLLFVTPLPKDYDPRESADCTSSRFAPVVDTIFATTNLASATYVAYAVGRDEQGHTRLSIMAGFLVAAAWVGSAAHGYVATSRCIKAKEQNDESLDLAFRTPMKLPPPRLGLSP